MQVFNSFQEMQAGATVGGRPQSAMSVFNAGGAQHTVTNISEDDYYDLLPEGIQDAYRLTGDMEDGLMRLQSEGKLLPEEAQTIKAGQSAFFKALNAYLQMLDGLRTPFASQASISRQDALAAQRGGR